MASNERILSPAKRAQRCVLNLIACFVLVAMAYVAFRPGLSTLGNSVVVSHAAEAVAVPRIVTANPGFQSPESFRVTLAATVAPRLGEKQ